MVLMRVCPAGDPPIVLLLIDGSFSMFQSSVWVPTYEALMAASGPIERYAKRVRFGFASYRGAGQLAEDDPTCADMEEVPYALDNSKSIRETCAAETGGSVLAEYTDQGGLATFAWAQSPEEVAGAVDSILEAIASTADR